MSAYRFDGMDLWYERHKAELLKGKGFVGGHKKKRYTSSPYNTEKATVFILKRGAIVHYGDEHNRNEHKVSEHHIGGYTQHLWSDGNITCNCKGWIYKRSTYRECKHCRELEDTLSIKPKSKTTSKSKQYSKLSIEIAECLCETEALLKSLK